MRIPIVTFGLTGLVVLGGMTSEALAIPPASVVAPERLTRLVTVTDVRSAGPAVEGRIVNRSDATVRDIQLVVSDEFVWKNERAPGDESPGFAETITVRESIPPGGSVTFRTTRPEPPPRADGRFETAVTVLGFTSQPDPTLGAR